MINCYRKFCIYSQDNKCQKDIILVDQTGACADFIDIRSDNLLIIKNRVRKKWAKEEKK